MLKLKRKKKEQEEIETRNSKLLKDFTTYCLSNPDQRFWQALRNWAGVAFIYFSDNFLNTQENCHTEDTFYLEDKNTLYKK
jgi:hypothetical protein